MRRIAHVCSLLEHSDPVSMSSSSIKRAYAARALRDFGDGFIVILLPVYLLASGFDAFQVGLVATLALLGSATMTLAIGFVGVKAGKRFLLLSAAGQIRTSRLTPHRMKTGPLKPRGRPAVLFIKWLPCSVSTHSPEDSQCNPCWSCGCLTNLACL